MAAFGRLLWYGRIGCERTEKDLISAMVSRASSEATLTSPAGPGATTESAEQLLLGGRFRVERRLGEGAMGQVFAARNLELDHPVALKLLLPEFRSELGRQQRLVREARAAAKLRSAHVAQVFDVVIEGPDAPFIVMELLEGEDIAEQLSAHGPFALEKVIEIVAQIGEALGEAHALGIVHRDVKPRNVFAVRRPGEPPLYKLLDLGIAHLSDPKFETLTSSQQLLGSPAYCAPEQLRAASDVSAAMDIWSIGVLMYECLTGKRPFDGEGLGQLCVQILEHEPAPPSQNSAQVPEAVDMLVLRCLAKRPEERFASIAELLRACAPYAPSSCTRALDYLASVERRIAPGSRHSSSIAAVSTEACAPTHAVTAVSPVASTTPASAAVKRPWLRRVWLVAVFAAASLALFQWATRDQTETADHDITPSQVNSLEPSAQASSPQFPTAPTAASMRGEPSPSVKPAPDPMATTVSTAAPSTKAAEPNPRTQRNAATGKQPSPPGSKSAGIAPVSGSTPRWVESR